MSISSDDAHLTVPALLRRNAVDFADIPALTCYRAQGARTLTWSELRADVMAFASGLTALGLVRGDRMLIAMSKRPEHWIADLAAAHIGVISCSTYDSLSVNDIRHAAGHSGARVVVLEGYSQAKAWLPVLHEQTTPPLVIFVESGAVPTGEGMSFDDVRTSGRDAEPAEMDALVADVDPSDPLCMIYTSGTTGVPKGVVLSHRNVLYVSAAIVASAPVREHPRSISYLPLAHIAERLFGIYLPLWTAGHATICRDPADFDDVLADVRPEVLGGVPRTYEKIAQRFQAMIDLLPPNERAAVDRARTTVLECQRLRATGAPVPIELETSAAQYDYSVLRGLRAALGLDRIARATVGGAPIAPSVLEELAGVGLPLLELYGLSETAGVVTLSTPEHCRVGAVGSQIDGTEIAIADDGEIVVRGPSVFLGYLDADGEIEPDIDGSGWYRTGDLGGVDERGFLDVTGRKKELIITSGGKNISPAKIEAKLLSHPLVGHAMVVGERRKYVTAVLVLDEHVAAQWAQSQGLDTIELPRIARQDALISELKKHVEQVNSSLARVEQVKRYVLLERPWSVATGELTPTSKMRRTQIAELYADEIDRMYL